MKLRVLLLLLICYSGYASGQSFAPRFDHITSENGLPQNTVNGIIKDKYGFMWFGTFSGLCRYDGYRFKIYQSKPGNSRSLINNRIHNIIKDEHQDIWILTFDDKILCKYNYVTDDFERVPASHLSPAFLHNISRRAHVDETVIAFRNYRWSMDPRDNYLIQRYLPNGKPTIFPSNPINRWALNDSYVTDIYLDDQDIFWVGTNSNGVNKADLHAKPFYYYYHEPKDPNSIVDNNVRSICEDKKGGLWVGTRDKGISVINNRNTVTRLLQHNSSNKNTINSDNIRKLFCDSRGDIWIATKKGLDLLRSANKSITHFEQLQLKNTSVFGIAEDFEGNMWFASWKGIYKYVVSKDSLIHYDPEKYLKDKHVMTIYEDHAHRLWVGTEGGGVSVIDQTAGDGIRVHSYFVYRDMADVGLSNDRIYAIFEDRDHFMWIGTGSGLDRYNPQTNTFKHFNSSPNGLANSTIAGITQDSKGYLWISHKRGISKIDPKDFSIRNYSTQDGLQSYEFNDGAVYRSVLNGRLYFGGNKGLNAFFPDSIKADMSPPRVVLTELQVLNKPVGVNEKVNGRIILKKPLYLSNGITLHYDDKSFAVEFAGLHFANPSGNRYAYMLDGFDKDWIYTDATRRLASYSNLSPGSYTLKVKASNSDGVWDASPQLLKIEVLPPWWKTFYAYISYVLLFGALLYAFYTYSTRYARLKAKLSYEAVMHGKELEMRQRKIEFFTNISHEIKTPLTLILSPVDRLSSLTVGNKQVVNEVRTLRSNADRLLKLVNQLLDFRKLDTGNEELRLQPVDVRALINNVVDSFESMTIERNIEVVAEFPSESIRWKCDVDKLENVIYNLLSNACKFSYDHGKVNIRVHILNNVSPKLLVIEVEDHGVGIAVNNLAEIFQPFKQVNPQKAGGTGLGLAYSKALIEMHGGTISVASELQQPGANHTIFRITLPELFIDNGFANELSDLGEVSEIFTNSADGVGQPHELLLNADGKLPVLLIVEDNQELRRYLRQSFEKNYRIIEAANGREGLAVANRENPDLILTDMMMPEMTGLELCKKIKSDIATRHIPVVILTAKTLIEYQIEGVEIGADDYILKPFNPRLLALKIRNLLITRMEMREQMKKEIMLAPTEINLESPDEKLLKKIIDCIDEKMNDSSLGPDDIGDIVGISRSSLHRKVKSITGMSITELIKSIRLRKAEQLIREKGFNINEVMNIVGFSSPSNFRQSFKEQFGVAPSEYSKGG